jgi:1-acyl-sn-glycerol-3-phosphate acyltransferase
VERDGHDLAGARALLAALGQGRVVALAPEGRRSRDGRLGAIGLPISRLAVRAGVPVVPVGITGAYEALPPGARFPRPRPIVLRVGEPLYFERTTPAEEAARRLHEAIAALLPPERRRANAPRSGDHSAIARPQGGAVCSEPVADRALRGPR